MTSNTERLHGDAAARALEPLVRYRVLELAFGTDMFALSAPGTFRRLTDELDAADGLDTGTLEYSIDGRRVLRVAIDDQPATDIPAVPGRGDPTLDLLGRYVRTTCWDESEGRVRMDALAGSRITYSFDGSRDRLLIRTDASVDVPHVESTPT